MRNKPTIGEGDADCFAEGELVNVSGGINFPLIGNREISLPCIESERLINALDQLQAKMRMILQMPFVWGEVEQSEMHPDLLNAFARYYQLRDQFRQDADLVRASVPPPSSKDSEDANEVTPEQEATAMDVPSNGLLGTPGADEACIEQLAATMQQLGVATRQLLREWRHHADESNLNTVLADKFAPPVKQFLDHFVVMRRQMYLRHLTTPEQESSRVERLRDIWRRDNRNRETIVRMETRLANLTEEREQDSKIKDGVVRELEDKIEHVENKAAEEIGNIIAEREGDLIAERAAYNIDRNRLENQCKENADNLKKLQDTHRLDETALKRKKYKVETELEGWLQKYDSEMGEKLETFETMSAEYEAENAEREDIEAKLDEMRDRYDSIMLSRQREEDQRRTAEELAHRRHEAATFIQAVWRGYLVRKKMKKGKKKGKKKKSISPGWESVEEEGKKKKKKKRRKGRRSRRRRRKRGRSKKGRSRSKKRRGRSKKARVVSKKGRIGSKKHRTRSKKGRKRGGSKKGSKKRKRKSKEKK